MKRLVVTLVTFAVLILTGIAAATPPKAATDPAAPCANLSGYDREACGVVARFIRAFSADRYPALCGMVTDRFLLSRFGGLKSCLRTPSGPGRTAPTIKVVRVIASQEEASVWVRPRKELGLWCLFRVGTSFKVDDVLVAWSAWSPMLAIRRYC